VRKNYTGMPGQSGRPCEAKAPDTHEWAYDLVSGVATCTICRTGSVPGAPGVSFFRRQAFVIATDDQGEIEDNDAQPSTAPADVAAVPGLI
jgi:hypothetical protein